ncbi:hypothetical protein [Pontibacillus yanchengensis]|uniref:Uncharacterized protein n=1 Tax=Pontibacillus yanchengensis Y32 TaxID=1385514 RepID=A0A0A2TZG4_9BACI|nr:hypothetical protein [Pontibacillus yanchengensis]KGP74665.1 hypothetical protein N782_00220 [Pontibacillus yanchengensis Y32]
MAMIVKEKEPVIRNVAGVANALKVPASSLEVESGLENLYLSITKDGEDNLFPFTYNEEKDDYRILQIPFKYSEEDILNGEIIQVEVKDS